MFATNEQPAKVLNHNTRMERHGDELVLCSDLKLQMTCSAKALDAFDPALRTFLYRERSLGDEPVQAQIDGDKDDEKLTRRMPLLEPLSLDEKLPGYALQIVPGMGLTEPLVLPKVELSSFGIEALDDGEEISGGEFAFLPTVDDILGHMQTSAYDIAITPAAQADYEGRLAA